MNSFSKSAHDRDSIMPDGFQTWNIRLDAHKRLFSFVQIPIRVWIVVRIIANGAFHLFAKSERGVELHLRPCYAC